MARLTLWILSYPSCRSLIYIKYCMNPVFPAYASFLICCQHSSAELVKFFAYVQDLCLFLTVSLLSYIAKRNARRVKSLQLKLNFRCCQTSCSQKLGAFVFAWKLFGAPWMQVPFQNFAPVFHSVNCQWEDPPSPLFPLKQLL